MSISKVTKGRAGMGRSAALGLSASSAVSANFVGAINVTAASLMTAPAHAYPGLTLQTIRVVLTATGASGTEVDSGVSIPAKSFVLAAFVDMATGASSVTPLLDVGTLSTASGGDADGFLAALNVSGAGALKGSMLASARTLGALSFVGTAASLMFIQPYLNDIARNVSWTSAAVTSAQNGEIVLLVATV